MKPAPADAQGARAACDDQGFQPPGANLLFPVNRSRRIALALLVALTFLAYWSTGIGRSAVADPHAESAPSAHPLILQSPTISRTRIAFVYGGDIWSVARQGGTARRIVTGMGIAGDPYFSPDGSRIAFSARYDSDIDVYIVSADGGEPQRLTFHPAASIVVGWTPDGKDVIFRSGRAAMNEAQQLYAIPASGGEAVMLPFPDAWAGTFAANGARFAYVPYGQYEPYWHDYRGGQTTPVWVADMTDSSVVAIPRDNSNDRDPMWIGDTIYFLSDRDGGTFGLFAYDTRTRAVRRVLAPGGFGIVAASANGTEIVYSTFTAIHVYHTVSGSDRTAPIALAADMPELRPHWVNVGRQIVNAGISPTGVRAVFEAHGDILTVPVENGSIRDITATPAVEERDPAWSPDGKSIAYFSDASGEYDLRIRDQRGLEPERRVALEPHGSFYYSPRWSPDGKRIAYADKHLGVYEVDLDQSRPEPVKVAQQPFEDFGEARLDGGWSPDSRYLAYAQLLRNFEHAIVVYDTQTGEHHQITDGLSDATSPVFDASGKYLYFLASTNEGLSEHGLDMSGDERATSSSVYAVTLQRDVASPTAPKTADEPASDESPRPQIPGASPSPAATASASPRPIDFDGIGQRIVALPLPQENYDRLDAGAAGSFLMTWGPEATAENDPTKLTLARYDLDTRKSTQLADGISSFVASHDGKKMLLHVDDRWYIVATTAPFRPPDGLLPTGQMSVYSVPREEWAQMYHEVWRIEREFFYDPNFHGLDLAEAEKRFAVFLPGLASRADLTALIKQMIGYLEVGHLWVYGGSEPQTEPLHIGLLGADYRAENGRYRIARIYSGENWNPQLRAPLTGPGVDVHVGDYVLAVNGREVHGDESFYGAFEHTAGEQTTITVGPNPTPAGSREVTVVPVASESNLRNLAWIEHNREVVDRLSGGKLAYVYMPDTEYAGFTNFNRYFFAQIDKQGLILDERYNSGGQIADYVIDLLSRRPQGVVRARDGQEYYEPPLTMLGPKVMVINAYAGSGGDALPWLFRKAGLGTIVGERTWGGLIGIGGYPELMDGGHVMAPRIGIGGLHGEWEVEGHGVAPDIAVPEDPKLWREGHDAQLEAAIHTAMAQLKAHPVPSYTAPPYPNYHPEVPI